MLTDTTKDCNPLEVASECSRHLSLRCLSLFPKVHVVPNLDENSPTGAKARSRHQIDKLKH
jgi:hypothetical protein